MLRKLYMDMYEGRGKDNPPITTRLSVLEVAMEAIKANANKALWLLLTILATGVLNLLVHLSGK